MAYAVKYISEFDSTIPAITGYKVEILVKGYVGGITRLMAGGTPVLIKCSEDTPNAPIKGFSATFTYLNQNNAYPISSFYSTSDVEIKMRVSYGTQVIFEGFLVQDDFSEILWDANHEVTLSANDNLGLLKDVLFNTAALALSIAIDTKISIKTFLSICLQTTNLQLQTNVCEEVYTFPQPFTEVASMSAVAAENKFYTTMQASHFKIGQVITISGSVANNGTYTILNLDNTYFANFTVAGPVVNESNTQNVTFAWSASYYWMDTMIDPNSFYKDDATYESCYDVLCRILDRFRATLFQANGQWNITGWDEMRYYASYAIPSRVYDYQFVPISSATLPQPINIGYGGTTYPEYGVSTRPFRPYKYTKETFNYKMNNDILCSADLQKPGALLRQYTSGIYTYYEYEIPGCWTHIYSDVAYIRVIKITASNSETDRYVYQPKINNGLPMGYQRFNAVEFKHVEVSQYDRFDFGISMKASSSTGDNIKFRWGFFLQTTTGQYYNLVNQYGTGSNELHWVLLNVTPIQSIGFASTVLAANATDYYSFSLANEDFRGTVPEFPADGLLKIRIYGTSDTDVAQPNRDAIWKDITFNMHYYTNQTANIIGQTHQSTQATDTKNKNEKEIYIDSVTSNSIQGCIFKPQTSGLLQVRTNAWCRGHITEARNLGEITTFEHLFWKRITRRIIDGNFRNLLQLGTHISMAAPVQYVDFPDLIFVWGLLTLDLKRSTATGTLYEMPNISEIDIYLTSIYEFKYLYDTK